MQAMELPISIFAVSALTIFVINDLAMLLQSVESVISSEFQLNTCQIVSKIEYVFRLGLVT
jgi:hypothetical protein